MGEVIFINKKGVKMNILTEDEALKIFKAEDSIANDEERWVTMNGRHVLIRNGEPVGLNIKKWTGAPSKERLKEAQNETWRKRSEAGTQLDKVRNSPAYKRAQNQIKKIDKEMDGRYYNWHRNDERHAALLALREEYASQMKAMEKGAKTKFDDLDKRFDNLFKVNRSNEKNGTFTNQTAKRDRLVRNVENAEKARLGREKKIKEKAEAIEEKYNKMAERIKNRYKDSRPFSMSQLESSVIRRGQKLADLVREKARTGLTWSERKRNAEFENEAELNKTNKKIDALQKFKSEARPKIQSAREANRYLAERSSNIKKATPDMVGGRFNNEKKEIKNNVKEFSNVSRRMDRENKKSWNQYQKEMDEINKKQDNLRNKSISKNIGLGNAAVRLAGLNGEKYKSLIHRITERQNRLGQQYSEQQKDLLEQANRSNERHSQRINANNKEVDKAAEEMNRKNAKTVRKYDAIKSFLDGYRSKRK